MNTSQLPGSTSIYRGHSRKGIGEGPENPISHGEQYLAAGGNFGKDSALLNEIRSWMTFDADPGEQKKLRGQPMEGWSIFSAGGYQFVVRLVSAGIYDRRNAYFAHGRAWKVGEWPSGFDPGILLGVSRAFDTPWRDKDPGEHASHEVDEKDFAIQQIGKDDTVVASRFLGHLFQAMEEDRPIVIAAPMNEFAEHGPLPHFTWIRAGCVAQRFESSLHYKNLYQ